MRRCHVPWFVLFASCSLLLSSCVVTLPVINGDHDDLPEQLCPPTSGPPNFKKLACRIDHLEKHIDWFGSIVPKQPDVWGQERLMMHRQEFERVMKARLDSFQFSVQGLIATSDQAYLANALSLQAAASGASLPDGVSSLVPNDPIARDTLTSTAKTASLLANGKLTIEPTILEDQRRRFLNHLHELRRINEGDDTADAPGYSLNLVSIPISVLTGSRTQRGFGAECTITATPRLTDDLLPNTFRDLVINDLLELLGLQVTQAMEGLIDNDKYKEAVKLWNLLDFIEKEAATNPSKRPTKEERKQALVALEEAKEIIKSAQGPGLSLRPGKKRALSPSEANLVFRTNNILGVALELRDQIVETHRACNKKLYYLDVKRALRAELNTAYEFLSTERNRPLWECCSPALVEAIRSRDVKATYEILSQFRRMLEASVQSASSRNGNFLPDDTITRALAWAIIVESALLTDRFLDDMRDTAVSKSCNCAPTGWVPLYLPNPPHEARQLFNDYVRCRWPVRVFALDPETEDQNIGDSFRLRREMQLALSVAFAGGQIGARNFTRYARRIERDMDTIALNRTMIGFSHGNDTFGWRFYPRVQTPPIDGNLQAFFRDLLIGGFRPGYHLRRRRLENGMRRCVALVIMPSFVPHVDFEVTANWFRLDFPKCKKLTLKQTMRLSEEVQSIRASANAELDQHCYRPGDAGLLLTRLNQLSKRLPFQHLLVDVPYANTHGGFELLSKGATNLAPELYGWYGAPGINPEGDTTLFLVGNNFSVHQTRIIVGGRPLDASCTVECAKMTDPVSCSCNTSGQARAACSRTTTTAAHTTRSTDKIILASGRHLFNSRREAPTIINNVPASPAPPPSAITITTNPSVTASPTASPTSTNTASPTSTNTASPTVTTTVATPGGSVTTTSGNNSTSKSNGGSSSKIYQVELLSRQVMRVVIPKGIYHKDGMVDIHIATPYGVSAPLAVPVLCCSSKTDTSKATPTKAEGYELDPTRWTVKYYKLGKSLGRYCLGYGGLASGNTKINVKWDDALGTAPGWIKLAFGFKYRGTPMEDTTPDTAIKGSGGMYTLPAGYLDAVIKSYLDKINEFGPFTDETNPLGSEPLTVSIKVIPVDPGRDTKPISVPAQLKIIFEAALPAPIFPLHAPAPTPIRVKQPGEKPKPMTEVKE